MVAFGEVEGQMYEVLQNIKTSELREAHHFIRQPSTILLQKHFHLRNSSIILQKHFTLQYFSLAFGDHFTLRNSHFKLQNKLL